VVNENITSTSQMKKVGPRESFWPVCCSPKSVSGGNRFNSSKVKEGTMFYGTIDSGNVSDEIE
jgi:hypothetical protein